MKKEGAAELQKQCCDMAWCC